jgi:hypothetical protein
MLHLQLLVGLFTTVVEVSLDSSIRYSTQLNAHNPPPHSSFFISRCNGELYLLAPPGLGMFVWSLISRLILFRS